MSSLFDAVKRALDKIGKHNGHAFQESKFIAPEEYSNKEVADAIACEKVLHEYAVAKYLEGYARNRAKTAEEDLKRTYIGEQSLYDLADTVSEGETLNVYSGCLYSMSVQKKRSSSKLDKTKLANELRKTGMSATEVDKLFDKCSTKSAPATTRMVVPNE